MHCSDKNSKNLEIIASFHKNTQCGILLLFGHFSTFLSQSAQSNFIFDHSSPIYETYQSMTWENWGKIWAKLLDLNEIKQKI